MRFAIIGAGGIGSFYGSKLHQAGHDVLFIGQGKHLEAIQENGLTVNHDKFNFHGKVKATDFNDFLSNHRADSFDVVMICTKASTTTRIAQSLQSWINNLKTFIISMQNGVENEKILCQYINPKQILGGVARKFGAHIKSPGIITANGAGELVFGAFPNHQQNYKPVPLLNDLKAAFEESDIPTFIDANILKAIWRKLIVNNGINPLTTLTGLDTREVSSKVGLSEIVYGMMLETVKAAQLENIPLTKTDADDMYILVQTFEPIKSSMLIDYENGRDIELEEIAGVVLRICEQHKISAPFTYSIYHLLKTKVDKVSS
jgi:2-dehydropantoate 2-reductase